MDVKAACVIGWPVEHSRSPLIHEYWIGQLGLEATYRREAVPPTGLRISSPIWPSTVMWGRM